jgi:hypothetical protein
MRNQSVTTHNREQPALDSEKRKSLSPHEIERINQLEYQNRRLHKLYNISLLDRKILQEALEGTL